MAHYAADCWDMEIQVTLIIAYDDKNNDLNGEHNGNKNNENGAENNVKNSAEALFRRNLHLTAVFFDKLFNHVKTKAGASSLGGIKRFEDPFQLVLPEARSGVPHAY